KNYVGAAWQQVYWQANYQNIRHFDWEQMYQTNYNQNDPLDEQIYGPGRRSNYMVEERHTDQLDCSSRRSSDVYSSSRCGLYSDLRPSSPKRGPRGS
ncbi:hypothetical protein NE555_17370, partial [Alistipes onderdonkii]|uniref:hypothetical protein n=1 Tax=Alistipes onderdonkii TaxID=328813 RepID=UPI00210A8190